MLSAVIVPRSNMHTRMAWNVGLKYFFMSLNIREIPQIQRLFYWRSSLWLENKHTDDHYYLLDPLLSIFRSSLLTPSHYSLRRLILMRPVNKGRSINSMKVAFPRKHQFLLKKHNVNKFNHTYLGNFFQQFLCMSWIP